MSVAFLYQKYKSAIWSAPIMPMSLQIKGIFRSLFLRLTKYIYITLSNNIFYCHTVFPDGKYFTNPRILLAGGIDFRK